MKNSETTTEKGTQNIEKPHTGLTLSQNSKDYSEKVEPEYKNSKTNEFIFARKNKKEKWNIVYGNQVCTPRTFKTTTEAEKYIDSKPYELIIVMTLIAVNNSWKTLNNINK